MITIRLALATDLPELAILCQQTGLTHAPKRCTPAQTALGAALADQPEDCHH